MFKKVEVFYWIGLFEEFFLFKDFWKIFNCIFGKIKDVKIGFL